MKSRKLDLLIAVCTVGFLSAAYFGFFHWGIRQIRSTRRQTRDLQPQLLVVAKLERDVALGRKILAAVEESHARTRDGLLQGKEVDETLASVFRAAQNCGVKISTIKPGKAGSHGLYAERTVELRAVAKFASRRIRSHCTPDGTTSCIEAPGRQPWKNSRANSLRKLIFASASRRMMMHSMLLAKSWISDMSSGGCSMEAPPASAFFR